METPEINKRILQLIEYYANKSVKKFAENIQIPQQTLNRLFNIDSRTGKFPVATTDVLVSITRIYVDVDANWLLSGVGNMLKNGAIIQSIGNKSSNNTQIAGCTDVGILQNEINHLKELLNEKERMIQVLLEKR